MGMKFYFRVDVLDLTAFAEDSGLDVYVVIDLGNVDIGEKKLVDNLDVLTDMRWEVVVADTEEIMEQFMLICLVARTLHPLMIL